MTTPTETPPRRPKNLDQIEQLRSPRAQAEELRRYIAHGRAKIDAAAKLRRRAIVGMRAADMTWSEIIGETGLSDSAVRKAYKVGLTEMDAEADLYAEAH